MSYHDDRCPGCLDLTEKLHHGPFGLRIRNPDRFVGKDEIEIVDRRTREATRLSSPESNSGRQPPLSSIPARARMCRARSVVSGALLRIIPGRTTFSRVVNRRGKTGNWKNQTDCCGAQCSSHSSDTAERFFPSTVTVPADGRVRPPETCKKRCFPDPDRPEMRMDSPAPQENYPINRADLPTPVIAGSYNAWCSDHSSPLRSAS